METESHAATADRADLTIDSPTLRRMHGDWQKRQRGSLLPGRSEFDVVDFKYILGRLNLVQVHQDPLRFRYRVHGTECARLLGYDMTGKFVDQYPDPVYSTRVRRNFSSVVESPQPRCDLGKREVVDGRIIHFEALILPLAEDGETVDMLMVALSLPQLSGHAASLRPEMAGL
jgi:hypothetical protein